jgi:hypothetical protein
MGDSYGSGSHTDGWIIHGWGGGETGKITHGDWGHREFAIHYKLTLPPVP